MNTLSTFSSPLHTLLLLADSALPLGSFAFSSGLESFLAHHTASTTNNSRTTTNNPNTSSSSSSSSSAASTKLHAFDTFLSQSLANLASTALPYVLAGFHCLTFPALEDLDNDFDAATPCTVARRASVSQGKALLGVWERALCYSVPTSSQDPSAQAAGALMTAFAVERKGVRRPDPYGLGLGLNAHFAPLFGVCCRALGLSTQDTAYLFLLNHAKAVLSAAVRAGVMGPYQSQAVLAGPRLQGWIAEGVRRENEGDSGGGRGVHEAVVTVPVMDLWMGRHELLYSRIFNS